MASSNSLGRCDYSGALFKKYKGDVLMGLWEKLHCWMVKNLEEPFLLAEMHRVKALPVKETKLRLIKGNKQKDTNNYSLSELNKKLCAK